MGGLEILEIVIGLVFIYLLFSTLVTLIVEYISSRFSLRSNNLKKIIARALDDDNPKADQKTPSETFYEFPLIKYLGKNGKLPSYISSAKFAKTVLDIIRTGGKSDDLGKTSKLDKDSISKAIEDLPIMGDETKAVLKSFAKETNEDINEFGVKLENWFNETIERGQGWFNRQIKRITLLVSVAVAVILNIDSVRIYQSLSNNPDLRERLANHAGEYISSDTIPHSKQDSLILEKIESYYVDQIEPSTNQLGLGWDKFPHNYYKYPWCSGFRAWLTAFFGWLVTGLAISLGAPFWFGVLNKLTALRAAGKEFQEERKEQITKPKPVG